MNPLIKKPSAWLPISMSAAAFLLLLGYVIAFGISHDTRADEGVAAHLFQLLMGGQALIIGYFAIKYLSQNLRQALWVLLMQLIAGFLPLVLLYYFERL